MISLADISAKDALANPVLQIQSLSKTLCVNYIDLKGATAAETKTSIETACYEEYTGIFGILSERQHPFQSFKHAELMQEELIARLMNSIVLIVDSPQLTRRVLQPGQFDLQVPTELAFYDDGNHAFGQRRGKQLHGEKLPFTSRVTEITTGFSFKFKKGCPIQAILIPEPLFKLAQGIFADTSAKLIPVPLQELSLKRIPTILEYMHGEALPKERNCVPSGLWGIR